MTFIQPAGRGSMAAAGRLRKPILVRRQIDDGPLAAACGPLAQLLKINPARARAKRHEAHPGTS